MSFYGEKIRVELYGESHGDRVGVRIFGLPRGENVDLTAVRDFCDLRKSRNDGFSTPRRESDNIIFLSGVKENRLDGGVFEAYMENNDFKKCESVIPRPGHADYPAYIKYGFIPSGGGAFSGRLTAPLCIAGGVLLQLLMKFGIEIDAHIACVHGVCDDCFDELSQTVDGCFKKPFPVINDLVAEAMKEEIRSAKANGDSVGGVIECKITNLPVGLGGELFDGLEGRISQAVFGIPSVKGIDFGAGFSSAYLFGSENNDAFYFDEASVKTVTNRCGGILGGMSDGMPLIFNTAFKPVPTIKKEQRSVNLKTNENVTLSSGGRNDTCVLPRAVPSVISAAAMAVFDALCVEEKGDFK